MERLRVSYAAVVNAEDGTTLPLYDYTGNNMHADELGLHVRYIHDRYTAQLYPWHRVHMLAYAQEPLPDVSLHDLETGACKCERKDDVTREGLCGYCRHGQHVTRTYCGALR